VIAMTNKRQKQTVKYPDIEVELSDSDGNAFMIMGRVRKAMRRAGIAEEEIQKFRNEATAGDYDHMLQTCMKWVEIV